MIRLLYRISEIFVIETNVRLFPYIYYIIYMNANDCILVLYDKIARVIIYI